MSTDMYEELNGMWTDWTSLLYVLASIGTKVGAGIVGVIADHSEDLAQTDFFS